MRKRERKIDERRVQLVTAAAAVEAEAGDRVYNAADSGRSERGQEGREEARECEKERVHL